MSVPFMPVRLFEEALCDYTGARYAVAVNSCTSALLLACAWHLRDRDRGVFPISIPKRTYVSVPQSIIHAGGRVAFRDEAWLGAYQLKPFPVWDSARRFTGGMFVEGQFQCVSFHAAKILGDTQGGAILHDNAEADEWLRRARFDGRTEGVPPAKDSFRMVGWHCYMSPDVAARLNVKLSFLPRENADLPNDDYPDLSAFEVFR
jgi:dTDP-4-amino-4,6-dideoxygalactose transaminase